MSRIAPYFPPDPYYKQVWQAVTASDGSIYLRMEDEVRLSVFTTTGSLTITLNGMLIDLEGNVNTFQLVLAPTGSGSRESTTAVLGPGFLLYSYPTLSGGTPAVGAVTVSLELLQSHNTGGPIVKQLLFGALTAQGYFPNVQVGNTVTVSGTSTVSNLPTPSLITVTSPAAGANFTATVPANRVWEVFHVSYKFVASAQVATRNLFLLIASGGATIAELSGDSGYVANDTAILTFAFQTDMTELVVTGQPPSERRASFRMILDAGATITTQTDNIQTGDQYSQIRVGAMVYTV